MAVINDEEFNPIDANMLNFADDFVDNILFGSCYNYGFKKNKPMVTCNENYCIIETNQIAIHFLDRTLQPEYRDLYLEMRKGHFLNLESYERFTRILVEKYFPEGFDPKYFLIFCVTLSMMASFFCKSDPGIFDARNFAKESIRHFVQRCNVPEVAWKGMRDSAKGIVKMLQDSVNKLTSPDSSLVSDEIEHKVRFQEVLRDASGNAENNLEQQKAYACSKIEKYLEEYVYSKSRSELGLRSLKEPESLSVGNTSLTSVLKGNKRSSRSESDDKPRSGISNIVELILSDIIMKMDLLRNEIKSW